MTGPHFAILAAELFALSSSLSKFLLNGMDPCILAGLLYLGSGIGMAIVFGIRKLQTPDLEIPNIKRSEVLPLMGLTIAGGILGPVCLIYGLSVTQASTTSLLLNLEGILTAGLAWIVFKEHFDRRIVVEGIVLCWSSDLSIGSLLGPLLISGACLCWAIDNNLTRKVSLNDPVLLTIIKSLITGTTNVVLALSLGALL